MDLLFGKILWMLVAPLQPKNVVDSTRSNPSVFTVMLMYIHTMTHTHTLTHPGIRGEVHVKAKVKMIKDQHRFKQSSCGVQFFASEK